MTTTDYELAGDDDGLDTDQALDLEQALGEDAEELIADEGYSPADEAGAVEDYGTTLAELQAGESFDARELRSVPEGEPGDVDGAASTARRLVDPDEDGVVDTEDELLSTEVTGTGDADLSAEEAAVHRLEPDEDEDIAVDEGSTN